MFIKLTRSKSRTYAQLVESFRDEQGQPRQRTVATLGRVDEDGGTVDAVLRTLLRAKGRSGVDITTPQVRFESALALGDVWALDQLWRELGLDALAAVFRRARYTTPIEQAIRVMVFNRLCDADSKLGVLRWLDTVAMPAMPETATHQHLLRAMDALMVQAEVVEMELAKQIRPLVDRNLTVVFYDLTTVRIHGEGKVEEDLRAYGMNKETGGIARQFHTNHQSHPPNLPNAVMAILQPAQPL